MKYETFFNIWQRSAIPDGELLNIDEAEHTPQDKPRGQP